MLQDIKSKQQLASALQSQYQTSETTSRKTDTGVNPGTSSRTKIQSKAMDMASNIGLGSGSRTSNQDHVIVVDFFDDCDNCSQINSKLEEYSNWYRDNSKPVDFYKVNVQDRESKSFASEYSIDSIPTALFFKKGKLVDKVVGAQPAEIKKVLDNDLL
ncbi:hypothetical protein KGF57_004929 [Candida theae]|uniref:Thioredoxin domain-containing protein n=1 Tax=Candida theae TaxID=1198502 RepID=A0AAD5BB86_9ASCO|nr:uncharacterized protein KGF57_004929 [Candida theae]KAI5949099.1 hypothetical protein KGF57_004929 [Candida theae]